MAKVLVIDDDPNVLQSVTAIMKRGGHEVAGPPTVWLGSKPWRTLMRTW
jgi:DNA-binding NtrC family response regulator